LSSGKQPHTDQQIVSDLSEKCNTPIFRVNQSKRSEQHMNHVIIPNLNHCYLTIRKKNWNEFMIKKFRTGKMTDQKVSLTVLLHSQRQSIPVTSHGDSEGGGGIECWVSIFTLTFGTTKMAEVSTVHTSCTLLPGNTLVITSLRVTLNFFHCPYTHFTHVHFKGSCVPEEKDSCLWNVVHVWSENMDNGKSSKVFSDDFC
jgi:hypothetical protein